MRVYICTPIVSKDRSLSSVRARVDDLRRRLAERGHEAVSHLDCAVNGKWADKVGGNIALMLECDAILLDHNRRICKVCVLEEAVSKGIVKYKPFCFFHTREEFDIIGNRYVI